MPSARLALNTGMHIGRYWPGTEGLHALRPDETVTPLREYPKDKRASVAHISRLLDCWRLESWRLSVQISRLYHRCMLV
jgi:hypothetical protein